MYPVEYLQLSELSGEGGPRSCVVEVIEEISKTNVPETTRLPAKRAAEQTCMFK